MTMGLDFLPPVKVGVELEVLDSQRALSYLRDRSVWNAGRDGSLSSYSGGTEYKFTRPLYGNKAIKAVTDLCNSLHRGNGSADQSCGFHLHLDFDNWSYDGVKRFVQTAAPLYRKLSRILHSNRVREGGYCGSRDVTSYNADLSGATDIQSLGDRQRTRYYWMNLASLTRHHSIEIRMHHGTIRSDEVLTWMDFWTKLVFFVAENRNHKPTNIGSIYYASRLIKQLPLHPLTKKRFAANNPAWRGYTDN